MSAATDAQNIRACIADCAQARDWRGRWRPVNRLSADLALDGATPAIAASTAEAAGRLGAWLASLGKKP